MKTFEEKWKHTLLEDKYKIVAETYWRAALECVMEHHVELGIHDWTWIEQELGGGE